MRSTPLVIAALAAASALVLTGCGTTEQPAAESTSSASAVSVTDDRGKEVSLDAPATDVVALEWNAVESLVALGVMPVGVADVKGYGDYVVAAPLDEGVTDVGGRGEPSVDAIAGLAPDLVVSTNDLDESVIAQIEEIAPVLVLRGANAADGIGQMETNLEQMAELTGTGDVAAQLETDLDETIGAAKSTLTDAGIAGDSFALSDAFADGGQIYIRPYLAGSLLSDVAEEMGLVNGWEGEGDADYGLGSSDVEGLTTLPDDVHFLHLGAVDGDPYANELADNEIWTGLPFVKSGDVHRLAPGIWGFGGPASMTMFVDEVVAALTA
jgi:iron complex transport system substrate-binding protein